MLIGREYRKAISQAWSHIAYRWLAIWLIILWCASKGQPGIAAGLVVAAVDIIGGANSLATAFLLNEKSRNDWLDRLTNRCFYKLLVAEVRAGRSSNIDVDDLFKAASQEAVKDINRADQDASMEAGFLGATWWQWFGGIVSFIWKFVSFGLYYGSALYLGSGGRDL
jgi:hypothetical protein